MSDFRLPRRRGYWPCANNNVSDGVGVAMWTAVCWVAHALVYLVGSNTIEIYLYMACFKRVNKLVV